MGKMDHAKNSCFLCKIKQVLVNNLEHKKLAFLDQARGSKVSSKSISGKIEAVGVQEAVSYSHMNNLETQQTDDLFKGLKLFLIVGRFIGVIPYCGVFQKSYKDLQFKTKSSGVLISLIILAVLTVNLVLGIIDCVRQPKRNAYEIASSIRALVQFVWSWLLYFNFLVRGKKFLALFQSWAKTSVLYGTPDTHLKRDVTLITLVVLISAILENAVLHLEYFQSLDHISGNRFPVESNGRTILETYYNRSHEHWSRKISFHEIFAVTVFIQHKCMLYACNYMDIMIAVFSRAIYHKFKALCEVAGEQLANKSTARKGYNFVSGERADASAWTQLAYDHKKLCILLQQMEDFFSPLIFGSYFLNIYYICVQLLDGLATDNTNSVVHSIYAPWSFLHIIMRLYILSICAARIHSYAHQIRNVLQQCPINLYNTEVARLDLKVTTGPSIGFSGFGCFVVTKPFILKIIGVVFTFEIVLLQGVPTDKHCG